MFSFRISEERKQADGPAAMDSEARPGGFSWGGHPASRPPGASSFPGVLQEGLSSGNALEKG